MQLGSYQLTSLIGRGGMGEIWRASHRFLKRPAAVKLIRPETLETKAAGDARTMLLRFEREVQATSLLTSPHTVRIYDYGHEGDGTFYYAMELLVGCSFEELVNRTGPVSPARAVHLLMQSCEALAEAHFNGLIHRDVKPANLFLCRQGMQHDYVKVLDFGLVLPSQPPRPDAAKLTAENFAVGTPAFLAPEAALGTDELGPRTDVYALGCVAYWLLTGAYLFTGQTPMEIAMKHVRDQPEPPSRRLGSPLPRALETAIMLCLQKRPADRPADAAQVAELLKNSVPGPRWTENDAAAWWEHHHPERSSGGGTTEAPIGVMDAVVTPRIMEDSSELRSIAILPLANLMGDDAQQYFVLGMHQTLISELARIGALSVISRTSVLGYQGTNKRVDEIAAELGVSAVMEGSVLRAGESVRISLSLVSAHKERLLWSESYDGELRNVFQLQSRIAADVAARVSAALTPEEERRTVRRQTIDPRALDLFLRGEVLSASIDGADMHEAINLFQQALAVDPACAPAYAGLARCYNTLATFGFLTPRNAFPQSFAALEKALALDPELASAHASLGYARLFFEWDFESPRTLFQRSLALEPSSVAGLCDYGRYLTVVGEPDLATEVFERAIVLDPHSPVTRLWLGWGNYMSSRFREAVAVFESLVETAPKFVYGHLWLATSLAWLDQPELALRAAAPIPRTKEAFEDHNLACVLGAALGRAGDKAGAKDLLDRLVAASAERWVDPMFIAVVATAIGDFDNAIAQLRSAYEQRSLVVTYIDRHPFLDPLRGDPRFLELCLRVRLGAKNARS